MSRQRVIAYIISVWFRWSWVKTMIVKLYLRAKTKLQYNKAEYCKSLVNQDHYHYNNYSTAHHIKIMQLFSHIKQQIAQTFAYVYHNLNRVMTNNYAVKQKTNIKFPSRQTRMVDTTMINKFAHQHCFYLWKLVKLKTSLFKKVQYFLK